MPRKEKVQSFDLENGLSKLSLACIPQSWGENWRLLTQWGTRLAPNPSPLLRPSLTIFRLSNEGYSIGSEYHTIAYYWLGEGIRFHRASGAESFFRFDNEKRSLQKKIGRCLSSGRHGNFHKDPFHPWLRSILHWTNRGWYKEIVSHT